MNRRRNLPILIAVGVVLALVAMFVWRSEPRYGGRSLTDWAMDAQICEGLELTDKPDYLAASNAIHQMGPAAAKTAVDWLGSEERWEQFRSWTGIDRFYQESLETDQLERSTAAAMILRLGSEESRLSVEPRLLAAVASGRDDFGDRVGVLTNFSTTTWSKVEPLLLHTNRIVRRHASNLALRWTGDLKVNPEILWLAWSDPDHKSFQVITETLLVLHSLETNRLAEAIGTNYLSQLPDGFVSHQMAGNLAKLGPVGRYYLQAGTTNKSELIRIISTSYLKK